MTVTSEVSSAFYYGNNNDPQTFVVPFYFIKASHLKVTKTQSDGVTKTVLAETTDYTVDGAGDFSGGTITMVNTGPADDHRIFTSEQIAIERLLPVTQELDYITGGKFRAETNEEGLDRVVMILQQILRGGINFASFPHSSLSQLATDQAGHKYLQPYTGAIERNIDGRFKEELHFLDFVPAQYHEAIMNGTNTNCMAEYFKLALAAVLEKGGKLIFPAGKEILFKTGATLSSYPDFINNVEIDGQQCVFKLADDLPTDVITTTYGWIIITTHDPVTGVNRGDQVGIKNLYIHDIIFDFNARGNLSTTSPLLTVFNKEKCLVGLNIIGGDNVVVQRCVFKDFFATAAVMSSYSHNAIRNSKLLDCHFTGGDDGGIHSRNKDILGRSYSGANGDRVLDMDVEAPGASFWQTFDYKVVITQVSPDVRFDLIRVDGLAFDESSHNTVSVGTNVTLATNVLLSSWVGNWFDFSATNLDTGIAEGTVMREGWTGQPRIKFSSASGHSVGDTWTFEWADLRPRAFFYYGSIKEESTGNVVSGCTFDNGVRGLSAFGKQDRPMVINNIFKDLTNSAFSFYDCDSPIFANNSLDTCGEYGGEIYGNGGAIITGNIFRNTNLGGFMIDPSPTTNQDKYLITNNIFINPATCTSLLPGAPHTSGGPGGNYASGILWSGGSKNVKSLVISGNIIIDELATPKIEYGFQIADADNPVFENFVFTDNTVIGAISGPINPRLASQATVYRHDGHDWNNKLISFAEEFDNGASNTVDFNDGQKQKLTPVGPTAYSFINPTDGPCDLRLKLIDGANNNPTWPNNVKWQGGVEPMWTSGVDFINFYFDGTDYWGSAGFNFS